jgi:NDP-sugar pyrophosphorylase family protein
MKITEEDGIKTYEIEESDCIDKGWCFEIKGTTYDGNLKVFLSKALAVRGDQIVRGFEVVGGCQLIEGSQTVYGYQIIEGHQVIKGKQIIEGNQIVKACQIIEDDQIVGGDQIVIGNQFIGGDQKVKGVQGVGGYQKVEGKTLGIKKQESILKNTRIKNENHRRKRNKNLRD